MKSSRLGLIVIATVSLLSVAGSSLTAVPSTSEPYRLEKTELVALAAKAPAALRAPIVTVVEKPQASPSGDAHDYVSFARYTWPDPTKPDGLPYITRDGQHNLELVARGDHERLFSFVGNVTTLAAAWRVNHDNSVTSSTRCSCFTTHQHLRTGRKLPFGRGSKPISTG